MPVVSGRLNTAVADSGTITIPYPAGVKLSDIDAFSANHALVLNDNDVYPLSGGKFSVAFTPTAAVITNSSGTSWAAQTKLSLQATPFGTPAGLPIVPVTASMTLDLGFNGKCAFHPASDVTGRTVTIPSNAAVKFPVGAVIVFEVQTGAGDFTIAIDTDTLVLAGAGGTGPRTLTGPGRATAVKIASTVWQISGAGLS